MTLTVTPFLRNALLLDAVGSAAVGLLLVAMPTYLADLFLLPRILLLVVGIGIFGWVALLVIAARRPSLPAVLAWTFVLGNAGYVAASFGILLLGLVQPNMLGTLFVAAQALAVALFTLLQWLAIRAQPAIASH
jgi:hypothetical protein